MKKINIFNTLRHFLNVLLLIVALLGINTKAWGADCTFETSYSNVSKTAYGKWNSYKGFGNITVCSTNSSLKIVSVSMTVSMDGGGWDKGFKGSLKASDGTELKSNFEVDCGSTANCTATVNKSGISQIYFSTSNNYSKTRTVTITNIKVTYQYAASLSASNITMDNTPVGGYTEKKITVSYQNSTNSVTLSATEQSDANSFFTITPASRSISDCSGSAEFTVRFAPTSAVANATATYRFSGNGASADVTVTGTSFAVVNPTFTNSIASSYPVDDNATIDLRSLWTSNNTTGAITYSIVSFKESGINNDDGVDPAITDNRWLSLGKAGTVVVKMHQDASIGYNEKNESYTITINKYTPVFKWDGDASEKTAFSYFYNTTKANIFSTTNIDFGYTVVSDNTAAANVIDNALHVYNVEETATITVTQVENYKWNGKEKTYTITPVELNNHVPFTLNSSAKRDALYYGKSSNGAISCANDGTIELSQKGAIWTAEPLYYDIKFTGIPDKVSFTYSQSMATSTALGETGKAFIVYWSEDDGTGKPKSWNELWTSNGVKGDKNGHDVNNLQLAPSVRFLRFFFDATYTGYYKNIHVTELNQFSAAPAMVDFGTKGANFGTQEENVTFNHANAGRVTTMEIVGDDAEFFSIERSSIPGTGRDLYSTFTIAVRFDNKGEVRGEAPYSAVLHIVDNAEHELNIPLTGIRNGKTNPTFIFNANYLPYYINTNIANVASSTNTDYTNCPLMFETSDASVAQVIDGTLHIYNKKQPVTITIRQRGNEDYDEGSAAFTFTPREMPNIRVPFQMSKAIYDEGTPGYMCAWDGTDNEIRLGKAVTIFEAEAYDWEKKSFIISFAGTPGRISFMYKTSTSSSTSAKGILKGAQWMVEESADGRNWTVIWDIIGSPDDWQTVNELNLKPTTRYVRFSFLGNFAGYYKNINISELVGYKYLRAEADGRYLSRGAIYGTQAIVDDFGVPCRISNYTTDNTNVYTRFLFVDNQQYLYEADNHEIYTDDGTAQNAYNLWKQNVTDGTILTFQSGNEYPGDSRKGQYITLDGDALALTADVAAATKWQMEDYTEHPAHILEILNREAAEAASHDFATDVTTLEKVRSRVAENDFERTDIAVPALTLGERVSDYALDNTIEGPRAIYDNEITDLQPGFYRLTVKAFSRISSANMAWACHTAGAGMESVLAYIYANDVKYPIQSLYHSYQASPLEPSDELRDGYYYSTDLTSAGEAFDDAKRYLNDVYVYVEADPGKTTGTLRYGIKNPSYVPGAWLAFEEITLTRFSRKVYIFNGESTTGGTTDWQMGGNWNRNTQPDYRHVVSVQHDLVIDEEVSVYSLVIENDKSGNPVTVTIAPTGGLTLGAGGVKNATKDNFILQAGTTEATKGQTGYLRISPYTREPMPEASVELYTIGYYNMELEDHDNIGSWQYIGTPVVTDALAKTMFTNSWIYSWDETTGGWVNNRRRLVMEPFTGYATSQDANETGIKITYKGNLFEIDKETKTKVVNLSYTSSSAEPGCNVLANSFTAPIDITKFVLSDFSEGVDPTINLFNTGSKNNIAERVGKDVNLDMAGQYISIPIATASALVEKNGYPSVIPSMQGFYVNTTKNGTIKLDYERLIWKADYSKHGNVKLRAPRREREEQDAITGAMNIILTTEGWNDQVCLLESPEYTAEFVQGYDARKMVSGNMNIFTVAGEDKLAVDATNSIIGTRVGVRTGSETAYTFVFSHLLSENGLALYDAETEQTIDIDENTEYTFFAAPETEITDRFRIVARADAPAITTGVDGVENEAKAVKFIKDDQIYILKNGVLYNAMGAIVR